MPDYFERIVNASTGEVTIRNWTSEEIAAAEAAALVPPSEITKVQFVRAMRQLDLWDSYKATIESDPDWVYITNMPRNNPTLNTTANAVLGEETAQALLDNVFRLGKSL